MPIPILYNSSLVNVSDVINLESVTTSTTTSTTTTSTTTTSTTTIELTSTSTCHPVAYCCNKCLQAHSGSGIIVRDCFDWANYVVPCRSIFVSGYCFFLETGDKGRQFIVYYRHDYHCEPCFLDAASPYVIYVLIDTTCCSNYWDIDWDREVYDL